MKITFKNMKISSHNSIHRDVATQDPIDTDAQNQEIAMTLVQIVSNSLSWSSLSLMNSKNKSPVSDLILNNNQSVNTLTLTEKKRNQTLGTLSFLSLKNLAKMMTKDSPKILWEGKDLQLQKKTMMTKPDHLAKVNLTEMKMIKKITLQGQSQTALSPLAQ